MPWLLSRPPTLSIRWWVQLFGHVPFVGLPIVATAGGRSNASRERTAGERGEAH